MRRIYCILSRFLLVGTYQSRESPRHTRRYLLKYFILVGRTYSRHLRRYIGRYVQFWHALRTAQGWEGENTACGGTRFVNRKNSKFLNRVQRHAKVGDSRDQFPPSASGKRFPWYSDLAAGDVGDGREVFTFDGHL